jgi:hypothetical protein
MTERGRAVLLAPSRTATPSHSAAENESTMLTRVGDNQQWAPTSQRTSLARASNWRIAQVAPGDRRV